jgi:dTMP kinase
MIKNLVHPPSHGLLITLEGIDGSGKSTLAQAMKDALTNQNIPTFLTREPGGSELGKRLRSMLQERSVALCPKAEFLLFAADRAQHFHDVIVPNLQNGMVVISDRMADSSLVYQGFGRGLDLQFIQTVNAWAMNNIKPNLTIYLKISPAQARERLALRSPHLTAFEKDVDDLREKLVHGFETIFAKRDNVITLDALQSVEELANQATDVIIPLLKR